jgi:arylsulfatase A
VVFVWAISTKVHLAALSQCVSLLVPTARAAEKTNIVFIYADDLGYGDLSFYGMTRLQTPNVDRLARQGLLFIGDHSTSATCTPSRYSLLTGEYAWQQSGKGGHLWARGAG